MPDEITVLTCKRCEYVYARTSTAEPCPRCACKMCGDPAKWRGDRPGDHEMGRRFHLYCGGDMCAAELPNHG